MKMPNTKDTGSFIKGGPGENQSYKKYYGTIIINHIGDNIVVNYIDSLLDGFVLFN